VMLPTIKESERGEGYPLDKKSGTKEIPGKVMEGKVPPGPQRRGKGGKPICRFRGEGGLWRGYGKRGGVKVVFYLPEGERKGLPFSWNRGGVVEGKKRGREEVLPGRVRKKEGSALCTV